MELPVAKKPICGVNKMRWIRSWYRCAMGGLGALLAVNTAGAFTGVTLGYSWLSIGMAGVLGIPGVSALVLLDIIVK